MSKKPIMAFMFSIFITVLSIVSTLLGLLYPDFFYQKSLLPVQDLVTLTVGVPLLIISTWLAFRKSRRGYLAWLGTLGYFLYIYCGYAFTVSNDLQLIYIALFSLSLFALIQGWVALDIEPINLWFSKNTPLKTLAGYSVFWGLMLAYFWLTPTLLSIFSGKIPEYAVFLGNPDDICRVLDLGIVCPLAIISGLLLWRRRSLGYVLSSFFLFKGIAMGLVMVSTTWLSVEQKAISYNMAIFFGAFVIFTLILSYMFFRNLREETIKSYHDRNSVTYF